MTNKPRRSRWNLFSSEARTQRSRRWRDAFPRFLPLLGAAADGIVRSVVGFCKRLFTAGTSKSRRSAEAALSWTQFLSSILRPPNVNVTPVVVT